MFKTGAGAGSCAGAKIELDCRRSDHERMEDQTGGRRLANADADWGWLVHTADDTPLTLHYVRTDLNSTTVNTALCQD